MIDPLENFYLQRPFTWEGNYLVVLSKFGDSDEQVNHTRMLAGLNQLWF